jgi:periplasmic divalent cation tolerance protein
MSRKTPNHRKSTVLVVFVTAPAKGAVARKIARSVVSERLAACVIVVPVTCSIYRWQGKICADREFLLIMKTVRSVFSRLRRRILELHPYEVPEILALEVAGGDGRYLAWVRDSVRSSRHVTR